MASSDNLKRTPPVSVLGNDSIQGALTSKTEKFSGNRFIVKGKNQHVFTGSNLPRTSRTIPQLLVTSNPFLQRLCDVALVLAVAHSDLQLKLLFFREWSSKSEDLEISVQLR